MLMTARASRVIPVLLAGLLAGAGGSGPSLVDAARNVDREALRALLKQGANVNATDGAGTTALHWASFRDDLESADLLIRAGAKVNATNDLGATPLWTASQNGSETMVKRLLAAGADPNVALLAGETPLMVAARSGSPAVVEQLLVKGADPNAGGPGFTGLHEAVMRRNERIVAALLDHGADANAPLRTWTPLRRSSRDFNFDPELVGATPFWLAARYREPAIMRLLLKHGADPLFVHHEEYV